MGDIDELLDGVELYTKEQFDADNARITEVICAKHGIAPSEIEALIREHRYEHSSEDPEQEWIEIMTFARRAGWEVGPTNPR